MKPTLELETKNGAILADDDLVSILFTTGSTQAEEVQATIVHSNLPSLNERYKDACSHLNIGKVVLTRDSQVFVNAFMVL